MRRIRYDIALVAALLVVALTALGCRTWTAADYALEASYAAVTAVDFDQTTQIVADGRESNPVMSWGSGAWAPAAVYFPLTAVAHAAVSALLPPAWRRAWQGVTLGVELDVCETNWAAGYGLAVPR